MTVSQHSAVRSVEPTTAVWWLFVIWGIASVLLGVSLLFQPIASALVLVTIVAVFWLIGGIVEIVGALVHRTSHWVWRMLGGAFGAIIALFVLGHPLVGTLAAVSTLYLLVALSALLSGLTGLFGGDRSTARIVLSVFQIVLSCLMLVGDLDVVNLRLLVQAIGFIAIGGGIVAVVSALHFKGHATSSS
jgi:uncharacterized membrane protein HdeD (DUF308 family)